MSFGVTFKKAPLATLDALAFREPREFYLIAKALPGVKGALLLQTCNRVEVYLDATSLEEVGPRILSHWALETRFKLGELSHIAEVRREMEVVDHLVRLSAGFESMLVGETQILGQMKSALSMARSCEVDSTLLCDVFDRAISAGARIREQTGIGRGAISLGSAAVQLAESFIGSPKGWQVLVVGTGQVAMLTLKSLKTRGVSNVHVSGRSRSRTESFCRTYGGTPAGLDQIQKLLATVNLAIMATSATNFLITKQTIGPRLGSKLLILDLSIPRNVSPDVEEIGGVTLKTIDSLRGIADESLSRRRKLIDEAAPLVRERAEGIATLSRRERAEPIVSEIFKRANAIRAKELGRTLSRLKLTREEEKAVEDMTRSIVEKLLALPAVQLRKAAEKGDNELLLAGGQIFGGE